MRVLTRIAGRNQLVDLPSSSSSVPTSLLDTETFTVPDRSQVLFTLDIDIAGTVDVAGTLVEV